MALQQAAARASWGHSPGDAIARQVTIDEIVGVTESSFETQTVFTWNGSAFVPTGAVPRFYAELEARGIAANQAVFRS